MNTPGVTARRRMLMLLQLLETHLKPLAAR